MPRFFFSFLKKKLGGIFYAYFSFLLTWDPMRAKTSKRYSSLGIICIPVVSKLWRLIISPREDMYNVKRMGPSTEPWGTPQSTDYFSPNVPLIETVCFLSARYELNQPNTSPLMPNQCSRGWSKMSWFTTVSNAAERSKRSSMTTFLWCMANKMSFWILQGQFSYCVHSCIQTKRVRTFHCLCLLQFEK